MEAKLLTRLFNFASSHQVCNSDTVPCDKVGAASQPFGIKVLKRILHASKIWFNSFRVRLCPSYSRIQKLIKYVKIKILVKNLLNMEMVQPRAHQSCHFTISAILIISSKHKVELKSYVSNLTWFWPGRYLNVTIIHIDRHSTKLIGLSL